MNRLIGGMCVAIAAVSLAGCEGREDSAAPLASETRQLGEFSAVNMEGAARLEISIGPAPSVSVEANAATLRRITTEVRDGALYIQSKPKDWLVTEGRPRVTVKITMPQLASLKVQGGNDVRIEGFAGGSTQIRAEGAAHIKAQGRLDELTVYLAGAGHADLTNLIADQARVTVDGVGSVYVHPKEVLDATMNGVGAILYTGNPREVNTHMNGLGTISRREEDGEEEEPPPSDAQDRDAGPQVEYEGVERPPVKYTGESTEVI